MQEGAAQGASKAGSQDFPSFTDLQVPEGVFFAVRADGHNFHALTEEMEKPYDERFRTYLNEAIQEYLLARLSPPFFTFVFSDEIDLLFLAEETLFRRRIEKLDSLLAGALSAFLTRKLQAVAFFDARVVLLPELEDMVDYLGHRQAEAARDCINGYTYYTLQREGLSAKQAGDLMKGWKCDRMEAYLRRHGIHVEQVPPWQRRGTAFYWQPYQKPGVNPVTGEPTAATRYRLVQDDDLPAFSTETGRRLLEAALGARHALSAEGKRGQAPRPELAAGWEVP